MIVFIIWLEKRNLKINPHLPSLAKSTGERIGAMHCSSGVLGKRNDVFPGGCHHYASGALNRCTDRKQGRNTFLGLKEAAKNSIYIQHSSNIADVKLIKNGTRK